MQCIIKRKILIKYQKLVKNIELRKNMYSILVCDEYFIVLK